MLKSFAHSLAKKVVANWFWTTVGAGIGGIIQGIALAILASLKPAVFCSNPTPLGIKLGLSFATPTTIFFSIFKIWLVVGALVGPFRSWEELKALAKLGTAVVTQQLLRVFPDNHLVKRAHALALWFLDYRRLRMKLMTKQLLHNQLSHHDIEKIKAKGCYYRCPVGQMAVRKPVKIDDHVYDYDSLIFFYELHGQLPRFSAPKTLEDLVIDTDLENQITAALNEA